MPATIDKKITEKLPVILHFQGGGFCITKATWFMYYQFYSLLATTCQAIVISVSTHLAPEYRLPSAIDDGYTALLCLRSLARSDETNVVGDKLEFSRVFLMGDSSGGNLVHEVAARVGRDEENDCRFWSPLKLVGAIPVHPGFVRSYRSRSEMEGKEGLFLTLDMLDKLLALALPMGSTKDHPFTCPMGDVAPRLESLRLPPMMVCVADNDLMRDTQIEYIEAMKVAGKEVRLFVNQNVDHCFYFNKMAVDHDPCVGKATDELIDVVKEFIGAH
ncbi:alpha/beta-Hydrolases superfamily protein [Zostera marina]|uniref:Alpha/beta-Hydrolases superfamily protein n=1 Tax=Zostera marina TaxID=29655 RepID=A0A0K9PJ70_ZOSMR|nr:alpha/beta-Hydrolases superfamily protein [Zostera marina]